MINRRTRGQYPPAPPLFVMTTSEIASQSSEEVQWVIDLVRGIDTFTPPDDPLMGETDDNILAPNLEDLLRQPRTVLTTLSEEGSLTGFTLSVPIGQMDPTRAAETDETAYIYYIAITPAKRDQDFVKPLMAATYADLRHNGYSFFEVDLLLSENWADNFEKNLPVEAIVGKQDHVKWEKVGPQRSMRVDLGKLSNS